MGFGVATPYHCGNGFFRHGQSTALFPRQCAKTTLDTARDWIKITSDSDSALSATATPTCTTSARPGALPGRISPCRAKHPPLSSTHGTHCTARRQFGLSRPIAVGSGQPYAWAGGACLPSGPEWNGQEHPLAADPWRDRAHAGRNRPATRAHHGPASARSAAGPLGHGFRRSRTRLGVPGRTAGRVSPRGTPTGAGRERRTASAARPNPARPGDQRRLVDEPGGRGDSLAHVARARRQRVRSLSGHETSRPLGQGPGSQSRHSSSRRAHQSPRHGCDPLARRVSAALQRDDSIRNPRPGPVAQAGDPYYRTRPRPPDKLVV